MSNFIKIRLFEGALVTFVCLVTVQGLPIPTSQKYNQSLQLDDDGKYTVYWAFNDTHITFEVHVETRGYVGFGISPNGNMYPSDVVIGWVKDGHPYLTDRHTTAHAPPVLDKSQDWFLLHGEENDYGTVLKFARKLDTCDSEDMAIDDQTVRLIYSYHPDDPSSETDLKYHGFERRGTKSVSLLSSSLPPPSIEHEDIKNYEFRTRNYVVPDKDTTYLCTGFQMPDIGKHHMIEFEPIYTPGMEHFVHHLVILRCVGKHPELDMATAECLSDWPKGWPSCPERVIVWATGGGPFYFPENTGFSIGAPDDYSFYVMQTHYNNPSHKSGMIDSSGMRMKLTSKLRQHEAYAIAIAQSVSNYQVIPPHEEAFVSRGYCPAQCTANAQQDTNVEQTVVAGFLHAHLLGVGITLRHFRNGVEIEPMMDDPNYDFFFQEVRPIRNRTIKPGDSFIIECTYNSMKRSEASFGGFSTREEMCAAELYVYPKSTFKTCFSRPQFNTYKESGDALHQKFLHMNWQDTSVRNDFYQRLAASNITEGCVYIENGKHSVTQYSVVENVQPFNRTDTSKACASRH